MAEIGGGFAGVVENVDHDGFQACVHFLERPGKAHAVLGHFQAGHGDSAGVGGLGRPDIHAVVQEIFDRFVGAGHVGALADELHAVGDDLFRVVQQNVILGRAGNHDVHLDSPGLFAGMKFDAEFVGIVFHTVAAGRPHFQHILDFLAADAVRVVDVTVRAG